MRVLVQLLCSLFLCTLVGRGSGTNVGRAACSDVVHVLVEVFDGVVVGAENVEGVSVDLHVAADRQVSWGDGSVVLVHVLVSSLVQELALDDAAVLLGGLVDTELVIGEVERDDESAVDVLGHARVEARREAEYARRVVHGLEEVDLGLLGHEAVHLALGVLLVTKAVVGRYLAWDGLSRLGELNAAERELDLVALAVELLCEGVDALDLVGLAVGVDVGLGGDLVAGQVVVTDEGVAGLVHIDAVGELLAAEVDGETIPAVVSLVALTNFKSIITEVVVHDERQILTFGEETEDLTIVVQELLLGGDLTATELLLEELQELRVLLLRHGLLALLEVITRNGNRRRQFTSLGLFNKAFES